MRAPKAKPLPEGWARERPTEDVQCERCGFPSDGLDEEEAPMLVNRDTGEWACSRSCARWLNERRAEA